MSTINSSEQQKIKTFYDTVYYADATSACNPSRSQFRLAEKIGVNSTSNVLDVACGLGEFLSACRDMGAEVAGVDLSEKAIEACKENLPNGEFYACPAENLPFSDNEFSVITCLGSLEHFLDPLSALQEMMRVAKEDATFVILVPNKDFLTRKMGLYSGTYQIDAKEVVRTLDEWDTLFQDAGLSVQGRWKDLHVLSWQWISTGSWYAIPFRAAQAVALAVWPLKWQYQVFHLARVS